LAQNTLLLAGMSHDQRRQMGESGKKFAIQEFDRRSLLDQLVTRLAELQHH
jgi:hypothetical protein